MPKPTMHILYAAVISFFAVNNAVAQDDGTWEQTKEISSDIWDGTKEVSADVWDGTKKVSSDIWDGAKEVGSDVKEGISGDDNQNCSSDKNKNENKK